MRGEAELSAAYLPGLDTSIDPEWVVEERLAAKLGLTTRETGGTNAAEVVKAYVFGGSDELRVVLVGFPSTGGLEVPAHLEDAAREQFRLLLIRVAPDSAVTFMPREYMWSG